jgi:hypothetical protein
MQVLYLVLKLLLNIAVVYFRFIKPLLIQFLLLYDYHSLVYVIYIARLCLQERAIPRD